MKIYAILLSSGQTEYLYLNKAKDLDQALADAKRYMSKKYKIPVASFSVEIYVSRKFASLEHEPKEFVIIEETRRGIENKNKLMKKIVDKKSQRLFNKNKGKFTPAETKYLKEKLEI